MLLSTGYKARDEMFQLAAQLTQAPVKASLCPITDLYHILRLFS